MSKINMLLDEYAQSHQNRTNVIIHKICVPLIVLSVIGLLWAIPTPEFMQERSINWATITALFVFGYYLSLSMTYFLVMIPIIGVMYYLISQLAQTPYLLVASVAIFVVSWIFQFYGHKIEGKKPSFLKDLLFLLVGPLWVAKSLFRLK